MKEMLPGKSVTELLRYIQLIGNHLLLTIVLMLLRRDTGVIQSYYPSNQKIYKLDEQKLRFAIWRARLQT